MSKKGKKRVSIFGTPRHIGMSVPPVRSKLVREGATYADPVMAKMATREAR
jgi:hypothetical protein